jgi:glutamate dehydrogenase
VDELLAKGVPEDVAWAHVLGPELEQAPDIIAIAHATGRPVEAVAAAVHELGARLEVVWLLDALDQLPQPTRTQRWATQAVREDCLDALADLTRLEQVTGSLSIDGSRDLPALMLAVRALRALAA